MKKLKIAVLSGGISSEREVSLNSGAQVINALDKDKYNVVCYDPKTDLKKLIEDADKIDAALIILHGPYGEDGTVQGLLDLLDIPYQGTGVLGSAIAMNKLVSKQLYEKAGLKVPRYMVVKPDNIKDLDQCIKTLGLPLVIKPVNGGSSIGMSIVRSESMLKQAFEKAFIQDNTVLAESYIDGVELTVGILGNNELTALPVIEIIPGENYEFFDYEAKYKAGATQEICPARIDDNLTQKIQTYAKTAHSALCCIGYSRTDFILKNNEIYVLETNTIPGMTPTSLFPQAAEKAGYSFSQLLDKLIALSIENHQNKKAFKK
ncbi:D-alanine--D-alanine ligase [Desulfonema limicola]|uniref:D-alanine--D-alanine ligase n=1 Tax=Desulfonema limicola TaxID=45656 RepID=A0A975BCA8_9BACT|nr:D-alanine--D-alanine ligase [Desulfonema limicola]QTA82698.1 D-alanine--D-alanine ligase [Desulfonema limicola]